MDVTEAMASNSPSGCQLYVFGQHLCGKLERCGFEKFQKMYGIFLLELDIPKNKATSEIDCQNTPVAKATALGRLRAFSSLLNAGRRVLFVPHL